MSGKYKKSTDAYDMNLEGLENFLNALKDPPNVKLGVLGKSAKRKDGQLSNADIAKKHEFGEAGMPVRSMLRAPIIENMQGALEKVGYFNPDVFKKIVNDSDLSELTAQVGIVGETVVMDAFETGGNGKWPPSIMDYKKNHQTLVETRQLRDSITSELEKKGT